MNGRFFRFVVIIVLALLAASVAQPYLTRLLPGDTAPRPIASRGDLSDAERSIIAVFERVSPSVVQVVGRQGGGDLANEESEGVQSGTGFVWDDAGNIVTNNHVVEGTTDVAVRLASGRGNSGGHRRHGPELRSCRHPSAQFSERFRSRSLSAVPPISRSGNSHSRSAIRSGLISRSPLG